MVDLNISYKDYPQIIKSKKLNNYNEEENINSNLIVKIKDNGCGIKEPEKIFFAGYTTKGVGVGTGLGLAISQKIIEKHKGKIEVFSKVNQGSEFVITIPSK